MKKNLVTLLLLVTIPFTLLGCSNKVEPPITNKDESTIIKNAKSVDEYLKKEDYKSLSYAFIYNIKEGLRSYESSTSGTVKAKVMFFDYNIVYESVTYKNGRTFYSKDNSTSTLSNVKNEFYMVDKDKILVSKDLKKYNVYLTEEYHKTSYTPDQYTIMGYVFNDESIIKTELISDKGDTVSVKYTLDNDLATNWVKIDFKYNGDLQTYPTFKKIELTLEMGRDFTPISYSIHSIYDANRQFIGTTEVTQNGKCTFSKVNESIIIPNEAFLAEKLGTDPTTIETDETERDVKTELLDALKALDFATGVNIEGDLTINLMGNDLVLDIDANTSFDMEKISEDNLYNLLRFYAKFEGDENFNTLISIVKSFAGDKLDKYANILDNFKSLEIVYDANGEFYLIPTNQSDKHTTILKVKLTDIVDLVLQKVNVYNLISGSNKDLVEFEKIEGKDENNYQVKVLLNDDTNKAIKEGLDSLFEQEDYAMLKAILGYEDFDSINITIDVIDGVIDHADASFNYIKTEQEEPVSLITLHLEAKDQGYDFDSKIKYAEGLYNSYTSILELKARINELNSNVYVSRIYVSNVTKALEDYQALSDEEKTFFNDNDEADLIKNKDDVNNILEFLQVYYKYNLDELNNEDILELSKAYYKNSLKSNLLIPEIGQDNYNKIVDMDNLVDYSSFDSAITKINGDDETQWGLEEKEIKDIMIILEISHYNSSVNNSLFLKLLLAGLSYNVQDIEAKISNLYSSL